MTQPSKIQTELAKSLGIDIPSGATSGSISQLIKLENLRRAMDRHGVAGLPIEIAERVIRSQPNMSVCMHQTYTEISHKLKAAGIRQGCLVGYTHNASYGGQRQICVVVRLDARLARLCALDLSCSFEAIPSIYGSTDLSIDLVYTPADGFMPPHCLLPNKSSFHWQAIQKFISLMRPKLAPSDIYEHSTYGEFWRMSAVARALPLIEPATTEPPPTRALPKPHFCVVCGADGIRRKRAVMAEHRCERCVGKTLNNSNQRHCIYCGGTFLPHGPNSVRCDSCKQALT